MIVLLKILTKHFKEQRTENTEILWRRSDACGQNMKAAAAGRFQMLRNFFQCFIADRIKLCHAN